MCFSYPLFIVALAYLVSKWDSTTYQGHFYILGSHLFLKFTYWHHYRCLSLPPPHTHTHFTSLWDISTITDYNTVTQLKDLRRHLLIIYPLAKLVFWNEWLHFICVILRSHQFQQTTYAFTSALAPVHVLDVVCKRVMLAAQYIIIQQ